MTLNQIDDRMADLVKTERSTTREILELIRRAESMKLPEQLGYRDAYQWLIQRHKYSGSAAHRRIQAARLLREIPEVASKVEAGKVNLSTLCKMQTIIRAQQKATGVRPSIESKREAIIQIENKSSNQAEQVLQSLFPEAEVTQEKVVHKKDGGRRCTVELSSNAAELLDRVRELLSHTMPGASMGELVERLAKDFVTRNDPFQIAERKKRKAELKASEPSTQTKTQTDPKLAHCGTAAENHQFRTEETKSSN
ncbi:MAG: DUF222 domain-containing protein, partial [Bdellovibrionales bacterium]|nr:DUF222 domain-containing protein [Bdellovibrionales bacterium]